MGRDLIVSVVTEWRKQRRGLANWLIPATGLLVPTINLLLRLRRPDSLPLIYQDELFWERLSAQAWEPMAVMILPLGAILVTSLVTQVEYRDGGWKQLHAAPVSPTATYLAKVLAAMVMAFLTVAFFYLGVLAVGVVPRLMVDRVPYPPSPFPAAEFIRRDLVYFVDVLPIVGLQFGLGLLLRNVLAPVGIGLALWIGSASSLGWKFNYFLPYGYTSIDHFLETGKRVGRGAPTEIWILAVGVFLAIVVLGMLDTVPSRSADSLVVLGRPATFSPMPRAVVLLFHLAYWLIYFSLLAIVLVLALRTARGSVSVLPLLFTSPIVFLSVGAAVPFYLAYGWLFSAFLARRRIGKLIIGFVSTALVIAILALIGLGLTAPAGFSGIPGPVGAIAIVLGLAIAAGVHQATGLILRGFVAWHRESAVKAELTQRNREMELALIRARIDPHFLFNTLNNLDVLITKDPPAASAHLLKLCELLRFVLYEANAPTIPLAAELDYVEKYLALEETRTVNPAFASFEVVGDVAGVMVTPMLIIPLIENAFKHAAHLRTGEAIRARLTIERGRLTFLCRNLVGTRGTRNGPGGLGNELMRRRMELLYPGRHRLETADQDNWYTVNLTVDLDEPALHHR